MSKAKIVFLLLLFSLISCSQNSSFQGLSNTNSYSYDEAFKGENYNFSSNGRKFKIKFFFEQTQVFFSAIDESKNKQPLDSIGYLDQESSTKNYRYTLGQHDFDSDGTDELVILMTNESDAIAEMVIKVFKLSNNTWLNIESTPRIYMDNLLGKPNAIFRSNTIRINRNLRGFWNIWTFESGKLIGALDVDENYSRNN